MALFVFLCDEKVGILTPVKWFMVVGMCEGLLGVAKIWDIVFFCLMSYFFGIALKCSP